MIYVCGLSDVGLYNPKMVSAICHRISIAAHSSYMQFLCQLD